MSVDNVIDTFKDDLLLIDGKTVNSMIDDLDIVNNPFLQLNKINRRVDSIVNKSAKKVLNSKDFKILSDKEKADIIRDVVSIAPRSGYAKNVKAAEKVMLKFLKDNGMGIAPVAMPFNEERLDNAIRSIITQVLNEDEGGRSLNIIRDAFENISSSGSRGVFEATVDIIKERFNVNLVSKRMITDVDACDYCKSFENKNWVITRDDFYRFHDNCKCYIQVSII